MWVYQFGYLDQLRGFGDRPVWQSTLVLGVPSHREALGRARRTSGLGRRPLHCRISVPRFAFKTDMGEFASISPVQTARLSCGAVVCIAHDGEQGEFDRGA
jgi:hypothetical protein